MKAVQKDTDVTMEKDLRCPQAGCGLTVTRPLGSSSLCANGHEVPARTSAPGSTGEEATRRGPC